MNWQDLAAVTAPHPDTAPEGARPSAVLIALDASAEPSVILTQRAQHLRHHAGQISFPGGRIEAGESAAETALREASEEIGLAPKSVEIMGYLPGVVTTAGFHIAPVLGRLETIPALMPDPGEVDRILIEPIRPLLDPANHLSVQREHQGTRYRSWTIRHEHEFIWGATARLIVQWARLLGDDAAREQEA